MSPAQRKDPGLKEIGDLVVDVGDVPKKEIGSQIRGNEHDDRA